MEMKKILVLTNFITKCVDLYGRYQKGRGHNSHFQSQTKFDEIMTAAKILLWSVEIYGRCRDNQPASQPDTQTDIKSLKKS